MTTERIVIDVDKRDACDHVDVVPCRDDPSMGYCTKCGEDGFPLYEEGYGCGTCVELRKKLYSTEDLLVEMHKALIYAQAKLANKKLLADDRDLLLARISYATSLMKEFHEV